MNSILRQKKDLEVGRSTNNTFGEENWERSKELRKEGVKMSGRESHGFTLGWDKLLLVFWWMSQIFCWFLLFTLSVLWFVWLSSLYAHLFFYLLASIQIDWGSNIRNAVLSLIERTCRSKWHQVVPNVLLKFSSTKFGHGDRAWFP